MAKETKKANKFSQKAKESTQLSPLMNGKTKVDVDELLNEEITITGFDFMEQKNDNGETSRFAICTYAEDPEAFFFAGKVLTKICESWVEDYANAEEASEALYNEGGCPIKMKKGKTKKGNNIINVDIL